MVASSLSKADVILERAIQYRNLIYPNFPQKSGFPHHHAPSDRTNAITFKNTHSSFTRNFSGWTKDNCGANWQKKSTLCVPDGFTISLYQQLNVRTCIYKLHMLVYCINIPVGVERGHTPIETRNPTSLTMHTVIRTQQQCLTQLHREKEQVGKV